MTTARSQGMSMLSFRPPMKVRLTKKLAGRCSTYWRSDRSANHLTLTGGTSRTTMSKAPELVTRTPSAATKTSAVYWGLRPRAEPPRDERQSSSEHQQGCGFGNGRELSRVVFPAWVHLHAHESAVTAIQTLQMQPEHIAEGVG